MNTLKSRLRTIQILDVQSPALRRHASASHANVVLCLPLHSIPSLIMFWWHDDFVLIVLFSLLTCFLHTDCEHLW